MSLHLPEPKALVGCDTLVALPDGTVGGRTLFAKNSDRPKEECQPLVQRGRRRSVLPRCRYVRVDAGLAWAHAGSRPHWCWGYEHGFNEHGVVLGNEGLLSRLPEAEEPGLLGMELVRLGLERGRTAAEAVDVLIGLVSRHGQGRFRTTDGIRTQDNGFLVADAREAYVVETAGRDWAVQKVESLLAIGNLYGIGRGWDRVSPTAGEAARRLSGPGEGKLDFAAAFADPAPCPHDRAAQRRARSGALLRHHAGAVAPSTLMAILRDHHRGEGGGEPPGPSVGAALCMHHGEDFPNNTAASLVADLCADGSRLNVYWCSLYSPCLGVFLPLFLEGGIPRALARGGGAPDPLSPWWRFHRLAAAVREPGGEVLAERVRNAWWGLEDELLTTAYEVAADARERIRRGHLREARRRLTSYMRRNLLHALEVLGPL